MRSFLLLKYLTWVFLSGTSSGHKALEQKGQKSLPSSVSRSVNADIWIASWREKKEGPALSLPPLFYWCFSSWPCTPTIFLTLQQSAVTQPKGESDKCSCLTKLRYQSSPRSGKRRPLLPKTRELQVPVPNTQLKSLVKGEWWSTRIKEEWLCLFGKHQDLEPIQARLGYTCFDGKAGLFFFPSGQAHQMSCEFYVILWQLVNKY